MCSDNNYKEKDTVRNKIYVVTHKNWRWGSLKILGGIMLILFRFNFTTNKELDKLSKQPASRMVILLLLKFLKWIRLQQQQKKLVEQRKKSYHQKVYHPKSTTEPQFYHLATAYNFTNVTI